ncbi:hypothetical protein [Devosia sp. A449]
MIKSMEATKNNIVNGERGNSNSLHVRKLLEIFMSELKRNKNSIIRNKELEINAQDYFSSLSIPLTTNLFGEKYQVLRIAIDQIDLTAMNGRERNPECVLSLIHLVNSILNSNKPEDILVTKLSALDKDWEFSPHNAEQTIPATFLITSKLATRTKMAEQIWGEGRRQYVAMRRTGRASAAIGRIHIDYEYAVHLKNMDQEQRRTHWAALVPNLTQTTAVIELQNDPAIFPALELMMLWQIDNFPRSKI